MNILMCDTQYVFLQYFLLVPFDIFKNTFFIFDNYFSSYVAKNLENSGMACHQKQYSGLSLEEILEVRKANTEYLKKIVREFYDYFNGDLCIYGQDHIDVAEIIWHDELRNIPFILLEDGTGNYRKKSSHGQFLGYMGADEFFLGHNSRVQDIYLTGLWKIPNDLKRKVKIIDLRYLWEKKSMKEKQFFLDLYCINQSVFDEILEKTVCYLGGPFSRFGVLPLEKELASYRKIIAHFNPDDLYIKAHPTGFNIDYQKEFPGITVLMNPVPFEVIYFLTGHKLKTIASICSTASMIVDEDVEQLYFDTEGNPIEIKYPIEDLI